MSYETISNTKQGIDRNRHIDNNNEGIDEKVRRHDTNFANANCFTYFTAGNTNEVNQVPLGTDHVT